MGKKKEFEPVSDPFEFHARRNISNVVPLTHSEPQVEQTRRESSLAVDVSIQAPPLTTRKQTTEKSSMKKPSQKSVESSSGLAVRKTKNRPFQLESVEEDKELDDFMVRLKQQFGFGVTTNLLFRAAAAALLRSEPQIVKLGAKSLPPQSPEWQNKIAWAEYQQEWTRVIVNALVSSTPMRKEGE
jgi:hypothetical protein